MAVLAARCPWRSSTHRVIHLRGSPMGHPVEITTPIPSVEETAKTVGVSPSRTRELVRLAREIILQGQGSGAERRPVGKRRTKKHVRSRAGKS